MVFDGSFGDVSDSSSSHLPTPFPLGVDFRWSSINVSLGSAIRSDVTNASTAETFFVGSALFSTFSVTFARIVLGFGENLLAISDLQAVHFSIFTFHEFVTTGTVTVNAQISHHHRSKTTGATVDDCFDVGLHLCVVWKRVLLCRHLFLKVCGTHGEEQIACLWVTGLQCVLGVVVRDFLRLGWCARGCLFLAAFGGDKTCLLSSRFLPAAKGFLRAANLRCCSKPGSRSAPRTTSRASPSVLEIKKCCNSWSISFVIPRDNPLTTPHMGQLIHIRSSVQLPDKALSKAPTTTRTPDKADCEQTGKKPTARCWGAPDGEG